MVLVGGVEVVLLLQPTIRLFLFTAVDILKALAGHLHLDSHILTFLYLGHHDDYESTQQPEAHHAKKKPLAHDHIPEESAFRE